MIAPAMNTRPQEALAYWDLARQQARISRRLGLAALPRLKELVEETEAAVADSAAGNAVDQGFEVTLQFSVDARGFSRVEGELSGQLGLNCNGCAEVLVHSLKLPFACVLAESEAIADVLIEEGRIDGEKLPAEDVLVVGGSEVTVAQIVEDEILLNLPERLCTSEPCERAPELAYPASGESLVESKPDSGVVSGGASDDEENPFSVLAELKLDSSRKEQ